MPPRQPRVLSLLSSRCDIHGSVTDACHNPVREQLTHQRRELERRDRRCGAGRSRPAGRPASARVRTPWPLGVHLLRLPLSTTSL